MIGRSGAVSLMALLFFHPALHAQRGPILPSLVDDATIAAARAELADDPELLRDFNLMMESGGAFEYTDGEFRRVFPEIDADSTRAYSCSSPALSPSMSIGFVSAESEANTARLHELVCESALEHHLFCEYFESLAAYDQKIEEYFHIEGLSQTDGLAAVQEYLQSIRAELNEDFRDLPVDFVGVEDSAYVVGLGRPGCACYARVVFDYFSIFGIRFWPHLLSVDGGCA